MKHCLICTRAVSDGSCVTFELRADEEALLVKAGVETMGPLVYCKSCWGILNDPVAAPQLMRAATERLMLQYGVPPARAKAAADKLHTGLVEAQRRRKHKSVT